jgi:hypothetical protein
MKYDSHDLMFDGSKLILSGAVVNNLMAPWLQATPRVFILTAAAVFEVR